MRAMSVLITVVAVLALGAAPAGAASVIVRPNATKQLDFAWSLWSGATADAALADPILHTATPASSGGRIIAGLGPGSATLSFPAPVLPDGAVVTGATVWVYTSVGMLQKLTPSVSSGPDQLAQATWTSGSAAWRSIAFTPTAAQLSDLTLDLRTDGLIGITNSTVSAAYLQIDASAPDGATGADVDAIGDEPGDAAPATAAPATVTVVTPATVELPAAAKAVPVQVACPSDATAPCRGRVRIELLAAAPAKKGHGKGKARARSARCARGCRVIGDAPFTVAAGTSKPVKIKIKNAAYKMIPRGRTVKARVTVSSRDEHGHLTSTARSISIHRARF
jgi:hypothetical protein